MDFHISTLDKEKIRKGIISEEIINEIVFHPDLQGKGMNSQDTIFAKQFGEKIAVVYIFNSNKQTLTELFENIGKVSDYSDTQALYMTGLGSKQNSFYDTNKGTTIIGNIEKD
ncbi:MAG: hypothetical protein WC122_01965 [archaeon]